MLDGLVLLVTKGSIVLSSSTWASAISSTIMWVGCCCLTLKRSLLVFETFSIFRSLLINLCGGAIFVSKTRETCGCPPLSAVTVWIAGCFPLFFLPRTRGCFSIALLTVASSRMLDCNSVAGWTMLLVSNSSSFRGVCCAGITTNLATFFALLVFRFLLFGVLSFALLRSVTVAGFAVFLSSFPLAPSSRACPGEQAWLSSVHWLFKTLGFVVTSLD